MPLGLAFILGRRPPTRRYTYGYGRAEDLAGIAIVLAIAASALAAVYAAMHRRAHRQPVEHFGAVAAAAVVGFIGNESVARYRIRVGRRIGSAALVADGLHARTDGFTSLAVLLGAGGVALGGPWPTRSSASPSPSPSSSSSGRRPLRSDAASWTPSTPALVDQAEAVLAATPRASSPWATSASAGSETDRLRAERDVVVDPVFDVVRAHRVAVDAEHNLMHASPPGGCRSPPPTPSHVHGEDHHAPLSLIDL